MSYGELLPKKELYKWFYALFFRIVLPYTTNRPNYKLMVYNPLNLTVLMHLIAHMGTLGYPSHWLSEVLLAIIEDQVITTARPPRAFPAGPDDVSREYPERKLSTAPFADEMKTLVAMFQQALLFSISPSVIPSVDTIHEYSFSMPSDGDVCSSSSTDILLLVFNKPSSLSPYDAGQGMNLENMMRNLQRPSHRYILDPSFYELNKLLGTEEYVQLREGGMKVWINFKWYIEESKASVEMYGAVVDMMISKNWECTLVTIETWQSSFDDAILVKDVVKKGKCWV